MAVSATWVKDSPLGLAAMYHLKLTGLINGANTVNPQSLITDISMATYTANQGWVPSWAIVLSTYDGTHTVPSKVMVDNTALTATSIVVYCDATGSTSADLIVF